ncbi:hypothetical protein LTR70_007310 [Exophiala xenobiotica]|uniref:Only prolin and serin are matching in the corresponding protein n=1 Tax=Lithohypha guttulata TaxID=1690604 RepID=A0ABR0K3Y6_9EURO|nr:hypothetical protein LTR24_007080 [Lithohypha guttulata]KAK5314099.1 hypothetical protein LTR70_007310 [Exophiala xenobiotica]
MAESQHTPTSSTSSAASPWLSLWSRGHSSKSSTSSLGAASSPKQARNSLDLFGTQKRLEDVREEEDMPSRQICSFDDYRRGDSSNFMENTLPVSQALDYSLADQDAWSTNSQGEHHAKRQRSVDRPRHSVGRGFASSFGSLSRRWRNRSTVGPPLSIITNTTPLASPRTSLDTAANYRSRSTSIASNSHGIYSPASMHSFAEEPLPGSEVVPLYIDQGLQSPQEHEEDHAQATTPLLPPAMLNMHMHDSPVQSPLQSPSIAPAAFGHSARKSTDQQPFSFLPSPPLSARPSVASMPRSRANTATQDIPSLHLSGDRLDPWAMKLGHADFSIHPEPYQPTIIDLDSYKEFRANWEQARKQYAQHLARTVEHYGDTSKVYKLTEEKWSSIDEQWKQYDGRLNKALSPQLQRLSDGPATPDSPVSLLEKPVTRVVVPQMDKSGKFPEIGDTDIVGPLSVGVAKVPELQRANLTPPSSPRKRNFIKALGGMFTRV